MPPPPDFTIRRLGPAEIPSPLAATYGEDSAYFIRDDERALFDTVGRSSHHAEMPTDIEAVTLEVAGPRRRLFFQPEKTRAAIVTCGGLCPGINQVIRGLVRELLIQYRIQEVLGIRYGFQGLVAGGLPPMTLSLQAVEQIHHLGGSLLGTSRGPQDSERMVAFLRERQIDILFTIGGDGTSRGGLEISRALRAKGIPIAVVGLPKTIDNDINFVEKSFGFETAFSIAEQALKAAHAEAIGAFNGVGLVKIMGRHSGYITTLASLASGDVNFVFVPEVSFALDGPNGFLRVLEQRLASRGHALIAVAEGAGQELLQQEAAQLGRDASGNQRLADIGVFFKRSIEKHFNERGVPINVRYIDPSYMIRSAPTTSNDAVFCLHLAQSAAHAAMSGRTDMLVGIWKNTFTHVPLEAVISGRRRMDPNGPLWLSLLQAIEQPPRMMNC
jgi:6-phosphofructokinase 1